MKSRNRILLSGLAIGVLLASLSIGWQTYVELYGPGPPYYGRTTNMDKWEDPTLLFIALAVIAAVALLALRRIWHR